MTDQTSPASDDDISAALVALDAQHRRVEAAQRRYDEVAAAGRAELDRLRQPAADGPYDAGDAPPADADRTQTAAELLAVLRDEDRTVANIAADLEQARADRDRLRALLDSARAVGAQAIADRDQAQAVITAARAVARRLRTHLIANAGLLSMPFTDQPDTSPWTRITPVMTALTNALDGQPTSAQPPASVPAARAQGADADPARPSPVELIADALHRDQCACPAGWTGHPGEIHGEAPELAAVAVEALVRAGRRAGDTTPPDAPLARIDADGEIWYPQPDGRWLYSGDINVVATLHELEADSGPTRLVRLVPVPAEPTSPADPCPGDPHCRAGHRCPQHRTSPADREADR